MPYIDKEKFRMHIIRYNHNPLKVILTDEEKEKFIRMLDEVPPADVVERKKGKWIDDCSCSICHWIHEDDKGFALLIDYHFCPNCGAKMDGKETEYVGKSDTDDNR